MIVGFMLVTFGYAVLVYLKEAIARDSASRDAERYKLEINPGDAVGLNHVVSINTMHPLTLEVFLNSICHPLTNPDAQ